MLIEYLPSFMQELYEIKTIMEIEDRIFFDEGNKQYQINEIEPIYLCVKDLFKDQFIVSITKKSISHYETMLGIQKNSENIEIRRLNILAKYNELLPYTFRMLCKNIDMICKSIYSEKGFSVEIDFIEFIVKVRLELDVKSLINIVYDLLERMVPVNMILDLDLNYNKHIDLHKFKHSYLHKYTHQQLYDTAIH